MFSNTYQIISREFILKHVSEEDIFKRYLGIEPSTKGNFTNPLRKDKNPGCSFYINSQGRWKFKDYAGHFDWDCFNVVEYDQNLSFKEALLYIAVDFNLIEGNLQTIIKNQKPRSKESIGLRIKRRSWNRKDLAFWQQFGISEDTLTVFNVYPISNAWFVRNGLLTPAYFYTKENPAYAYHFGEYNYKIYLPLRSKHSGRFLQTSSEFLQGYAQLPKLGKHFLFTKSMKDVMCLYQFAHEYNLWSIAPMAETVVIKEEIFSDIYNRFDVFASLFDFDRAGIRLARKYESLYDIKPLFFGKQFKGGVFLNNTGIKDFSDHYKIKGKEATKALIDQFITIESTNEEVF